MSAVIIPVNTVLAPQAVSANAFSPSVNVGRGNMLALMLVVSAASSPGTASAVLQRSLDNINWADDTLSGGSITTNGTLSFEKPQAPFIWYRLKYLIASGSFTATLQFAAKGNGN